MKNKNTDNSRYGYPYVKNQANDILIIDIAISWAEKEKDSTANATLKLSYLKKNVTRWDYCWLIQELDSIPLDCNSLRIILFIHADTEASPSWANAVFIPCSRDGSTLNAICLFPFPDILMVDTWFTPAYIKLIYQVYDRCEPKTTPRSATNTIEASNQQPLIEVTTMAGIQHTQTRPKFTCLIALSNQRLMHLQRLIIILAGISSLRFVSRQEVRRG
ncbi:hypothetical protein [Xenorhabdus szentirmaii]|uniref:hypothetical protein n=1 Tax=Xenorhabdus szentirmaii TaxID=290112 RepID=UPI0019B86D93|nr:hypothetical protein [Xenorhabdus sp. 38]MBD2803908.1 hypothetical protein [Xenorhabdus sp. ZM]